MSPSKPTLSERVARLEKKDLDQRLLRYIALSVAAMCLIAAIFSVSYAGNASDTADNAEETADLNRSQQCRDFGRALTAQTRRLAVYRDGQIVPEQTRVYHSRLNSLRQSLIEAKSSECPVIKDFGRRRLNKLIEIEQRLGLNFQRGRGPKTAKGSNTSQSSVPTPPPSSEPNDGATSQPRPGGGQQPEDPSSPAPPPTPSPAPTQTETPGLLDPVCTVTKSLLNLC